MHAVHQDKWMNASMQQFMYFLTKIIHIKSSPGKPTIRVTFQASAFFNWSLYAIIEERLLRQQLQFQAPPRNKCLLGTRMTWVVLWDPPDRGTSADRDIPIGYCMALPPSAPRCVMAHYITLEDFSVAFSAYSACLCLFRIFVRFVRFWSEQVSCLWRPEQRSHWSLLCTVLVLDHAI